MLNPHWLTAEIPDDTAFFAFTDVHGHERALSGMMREILDFRLNLPEQTKLQVVVLGDYMDYGPDSRGVLQSLIEFDKLLKKLGLDIELIKLKGNHDVYAQRVLCGDNSEKDKEFWLMGSKKRISGLTTLQSYFPGEKITIDHVDRWAELMRTKYPEHVDFLHNLKLYHQIGDYLFVHAGINPELSWAEQSQPMISPKEKMPGILTMLPRMSAMQNKIHIWAGLGMTRNKMKYHDPFPSNSLPTNAKVVIRGHTLSRHNLSGPIVQKIVLPNVCRQDCLSLDTGVYLSKAKCGGGLTAFWRHQSLAGFIRVHPDGRDTMHYMMDDDGNVINPLGVLFNQMGSQMYRKWQHTL